MQKTKEEIQSLSAEALMTSNQILEKIRFWITDAAVINKLNNFKTWESIEEIIRGFIHQVATKIVPKSERWMLPRFASPAIQFVKSTN